MLAIAQGDATAIHRLGPAPHHPPVPQQPAIGIEQLWDDPRFGHRPDRADIVDEGFARFDQGDVQMGIQVPGECITGIAATNDRNAEGGGHCSGLRHHGALDMAQAIDFDAHDVAWLQELARIHGGADAAGRAGEQAIAGFQRHAD